MALTSPLPTPPFTTRDARSSFFGTPSNRMIADQLRALGYLPLAFPVGKGSTHIVWDRDRRKSAEADACVCRCHTGTCGENDMVMAERTIRLVERLRPMSRDMVDAVDDLVQRAGVDFARQSTGSYRTDDEVPF